MNNHMQRSQFAKDTAGKKPAMLSLLCTTEKNYSLVGKKKGEGWELGTFFNAPLLAVYNIMQSSTICNCVCKECIYWMPLWCWWPYPPERNLIQLLSLKATNNQTLPTLRQAEQQRIMQNKGELTMTKAPVRLRTLHLNQSAISP